MIWCHLHPRLLLFRHFCRYAAHMLDLMILYSAQRKQYVFLVRPKQSQGRYSTRVRLGNEELSFVEEFRYLEHVMTADCRYDKDIKKQFRGQNAVGNMLVRKFLFAPMEAKFQLFKSYRYTINGCAQWHHSYQNSIRKHTVRYLTHSNDLLL